MAPPPLSPLDRTLTQNPPVSPVSLTLTGNGHLNPPGITLLRKKGGIPPRFPPFLFRIRILPLGEFRCSRFEFRALLRASVSLWLARRGGPTSPRSDAPMVQRSAAVILVGTSNRISPLESHSYRKTGGGGVSSLSKISVSSYPIENESLTHVSPTHCTESLPAPHSWPSTVPMLRLACAPTKTRLPDRRERRLGNRNAPDFVA